MWSGPVGLALTNSTLTRVPWPRSGGRVAVDTLVDHLGEHVVEPAVGQPEVDEPGTGDLDRADMGRRSPR